MQLVDAEGRTNKVPAQFVVEALKNRPPDLKLVAPRGDQRVSPLEEMNFEAEIWDDFGVTGYGLTYTVAGSEPKTIALSEATGPNEKRKFNHLLRLENLAVHPDQLVSYFIWAEDFGPDGQLRRTSSDMYFAEVRPFEEIFREDQTPENSQSESAGGQQPQSPTTKLAELQKQIINATWKLEREHGGKKPSPHYLKDAPVVEQSQKQALDQLDELKEKARSAEQKAYVEAAGTEMKKAVTHLTDATKSPKPLPDALAAEQAAYQALLKLQAREYSVSQNRSRGSGSGSSQSNQRQIDQLDLKMSDSRYETQRQATPQKKTEQQEQAQVLNRLKELSQRQQDLNERLKELQTALQEAKGDQEREDIRRRLKRLREEEQQMLADIDEVRQRMEQPQNQQRMADARQQLDQIRSDVQNASQAMQNESVSQALASGTRAERDLQQMREDFRKQNSSQFTEEMRQMRNDARELAQKEEDLAQQMANPAQGQRKRLSDTGENKDLADKFDQQKQKMQHLLDDVKQVTERAESSEPLLSKQLYDTYRKASQGSANNALATASEMLKRSLPSEAAQAEQRARKEIEELKSSVEHAAESVLGDDTEALRLAKKELEDLSRQIEKEMASGASAGETNGVMAGATGDRVGGQPSSPGNTNRQTAAQGGQRGQGEQPGVPGSRSQASNSQPQSEAGQQPGSGQGNSPGNANRQASGQGGQRGQQGQPGQRGSGAQASNSQAQPGAEQAQQGQGEGNSPGGRGGQASAAGQVDAPQPGTQANAGGGRNPAGSPRGGAGFMNRGGGTEGGGNFTGGGPITGIEYSQWSDRLRDVEEMIDQPDLRNRVATVRERAAVIRQEFRREFKKPDFAQLSLQIVKPLAEVRNRIAEELARRESREALVPIDRDPVPTKYSELVRRYYEKLGSGDDAGGANSKPPATGPRTSFQ
ncbi:MAG: hypothetical protein HY043_12610 [Verrucomicrobia bacterium]|nr:hypothetical protein [Verrucomicrobiota bacterium]